MGSVNIYSEMRMSRLWNKMGIVFKAEFSQIAALAALGLIWSNVFVGGNRRENMAKRCTCRALEGQKLHIKQFSFSVT